MSPNKNLFKNFQISSKKVNIANKQIIKSEGHGEINIKLALNEKLTFIFNLSNGLYVSKIATNLISINKLTKLNFKVEFEDDSCTIKSKDNRIIATATKINGMYKLNTVEIKIINKEESLENKTHIDPDIWH